MPIINEGSYFTCSVASGGKDIRFPIPPGVWPSMDAISQYVNQQMLKNPVTLEAKVFFPEPEPAKEEAQSEESDLCQCTCSCYSCDCDDCPYRDDEPKPTPAVQCMEKIQKGGRIDAKDLPLLESLRPAPFTEEELILLQAARAKAEQDRQKELQDVQKALELFREIQQREHDAKLIQDYRMQQQ